MARERIRWLVVLAFVWLAFVFTSALALQRRGTSATNELPPAAVDCHSSPTTANAPASAFKSDPGLNYEMVVTKLSSIAPDAGIVAIGEGTVVAGRARIFLSETPGNAAEQVLAQVEPDAVCFVQALDAKAIDEATSVGWELQSREDERLHLIVNASTCATYEQSTPVVAYSDTAIVITLPIDDGVTHPISVCPWVKARLTILLDPSGTADKSIEPGLTATVQQL